VKIYDSPFGRSGCEVGGDVFFRQRLVFNAHTAFPPFATGSLELIPSFFTPAPPPGQPVTVLPSLLPIPSSCIDPVSVTAPLHRPPQFPWIPRALPLPSRLFFTPACIIFTSCAAVARSRCRAHPFSRYHAKRTVFFPTVTSRPAAPEATGPRPRLRQLRDGDVHR